MVVPLDSLHYHIINIDLYVPPNMVGEHDVHDSLVGGANIVEVEGCDIIVVVVVI